jgi:hypothetical protein
MQNVIDMWIETIDILRDALTAKDEEKSFEALTILLMQLVDCVGPTHPTVIKFMPALLDLKQKIHRKKFQECLPTVLAIKLLFGKARAELEESETPGRGKLETRRGSQDKGTKMGTSLRKKGTL